MNDQTNRIPVDEQFERNLKRFEKGLTTPHETAELARKLAAEPLPDGVLAPKVLALPDDVVPFAYTIHVFTTHCTNCATNHQHSEFYAINHIKSRMGSTFVRHMVPVPKPTWNVPLIVHNIQPRMVPFCHECVQACRDHTATLPLPPAPKALVNPVTPPAADRRQDKGLKPKTFNSVDDLLI